MHAVLAATPIVMTESQLGKGRMYAVFDTETTGISPSMGHRVIEIAVVLADENGRIESTWSTLLYPDRDLGPQHIHGIKARQVLDAPRFGDVAGRLIQLLSGRTLVAHNLPFDLRFLSAEFERLGYLLPYEHQLGVCTMKWSPAFLASAGRSLLDCCTAAGLELTDWHSALADATATASLLGHYIAQSDGQIPWGDQLRSSRCVVWPSVPVVDVEVRQRGSASSPVRGDDLAVLPLVPGDMVVFTGTMPESRDEWEQRVVEHGFVPWSAVTKRVKLVVAADPDSLSNKAKKARQYGIPIVDVDRFRAALCRTFDTTWTPGPPAA